MHVYTPGSPPPAASGEPKNTKHPTAQHGDTGASHGQPPERPRGSATCPRASTPASVPDTAFCRSILAGRDRTSFGAALPPAAPSRCPGVLPSRHVRVAAALQAGRCYPRGTPDLHLLAPRQSRACPGTQAEEYVNRLPKAAPLATLVASEDAVWSRLLDHFPREVRWQQLACRGSRGV